MAVLRGGQRKEVRVPLKPMRYLVPRARYDVEPCYFIYGGLVFQPLTRDFLATWDKWWNKAPKEFLYFYYNGTRTPEQQEVVVLTHILGDELNVGYDDMYNEAVVTMNGYRPRDMRDFVARMLAAEGVITLGTSGPGVLMIDAIEARKAHERILARYHIRSDRSRDLRNL
jgi:hypothetical protein